MQARKGQGENPRHVLIVSETTELHTKLVGIFNGKKISHESADTVQAALARLAATEEPPVTGVVTEGLGGEWRKLIPTVRHIGVATVLLTSSSIVKATALSEGVTAYHPNEFDRDIVGRPQSTRVTESLVADLTPRPPA